MTRLLRLLVQAYRHTIGITLPNSCRYHPTCSQYALDALSEYGAARGIWMTLKRIAHCHPWAPGGYDPVPPRATNRTDQRRASDTALDRRTTPA